MMNSLVNISLSETPHHAFTSDNGPRMGRERKHNGPLMMGKFAIVLCLLLTIGVGSVWGATTVTYTFSSASWEASPANWTGTTAYGFESSGLERGVQNTADNSCTSPVSYTRGVTSVVIVASSNAASNQIKVKIGSQEIATKTIAKSNDQTYTYSVSDYSGIARLSGNVIVEILHSSSSVYIKSITITYITEKFTLTYDAGSGTCATPSEEQENIGDAITLPEAVPNSYCEDEGWIFAGWAASSCSETVNKPTLYVAGSAYLPLEDETLYAVYRLGDVYTVDFESETSAYTNWTFNNIRLNAATPAITAYEGSQYGRNVNSDGNAVSTGSIVTNNKISDPKVLSCYVSKESDNTTSSTWYVEVSSDGSEWGGPVGSKSATEMGKGAWQDFSVNLTSYSDVYVRIRYSGSNAARAIDDLTLSCAIFNSNPDCIYDYFVDIMHNNATIEKKGTDYTMPDALSDAEPDAEHCDDKHYHFLGWVIEDEINEDGTLKSGFTLIPAGDDNSGSGYTAANKTYYAIWGKEE